MAYLGESVPKLGFGLMRLPMLGQEVDLEQTKTMVDRFMAAGFTYFDTAYGYINGKSEQAVKAALVERYPRDSFFLATKLPAWAGPKTAGEAQQMFWTSLERTGAGHFDFYLLHNISDGRIKSFDDYGIWDFLQARKAEGLIRHLGFSFHDTADVLDKVLAAHPEMEFVQLQLNYADWNSADVQARLCYETARKHGKPVIVMEPVKGGNLASLPEDVRAPFDKAGLEPVDAALRFAASLEGIVTVLSGMSTLAQMEQNIAFMRGFRPLSDTERAVIAEAVSALGKRHSIPCTACRYCEKDCPQGISIPDILSARNRELVYGDLAGAKGFYGMVSANAKASTCLSCGLCAAACPQKIDIPAELAAIASLYESK